MREVNLFSRFHKDGGPLRFGERLERATQKSHLCIGLDPVVERLPDCLGPRPEAVGDFLESMIVATSAYAGAFKPNLAFFEALGPMGDEALIHAIEIVRREAPSALIIGDAKRGDIGSTAERYAAALFGRFGFDAVTVNPYFGYDGVLPFTEWEQKGTYLLALTSNPSAGELQFFSGEKGIRLFEHVARLAEEDWNEHRNLGLVVGATKVDGLARAREMAPTLPFLLPGVGAQGGDLEAAVAHGLSAGAMPGLINASRSILYASSEEDYTERAAEVARDLNRRISEAKKPAA